MQINEKENFLVACSNQPHPQRDSQKLKNYRSNSSWSNHPLLTSQTKMRIIHAPCHDAPFCLLSKPLFCKIGFQKCISYPTSNKSSQLDREHRRYVRVAKEEEEKQEQWNTILRNKVICLNSSAQIPMPLFATCSSPVIYLPFKQISRLNSNHNPIKHLGYPNKPMFN